MAHRGNVKIVSSLAALAAIASGMVLAFTIVFDADPNEDGVDLPTITLGLTAEAREALQQSGDAFPASEAGFSAYYRVPDGSGGFGLDKNVVDQALLNEPGPTLRRAGPAMWIDAGGNFTIASVPIKNIDGLVTPVHVYYDDQGWIVAYLPKGSESSRAWQAVDLDAENPLLADVSRTALMDAINEVLVEALNEAPLTPNDLGYYHWGHPTATNFLMIATARGIDGSDIVSFAVPGNFTVYEVSVAMWIAGTGTPCARTLLDNVDLTSDQCDRSFHHVFPNLSDFNSLSAHTLELEHLGQDSGASGALVMLVYTAQ